MQRMSSVAICMVVVSLLALTAFSPSAASGQVLESDFQHGLIVPIPDGYQDFEADHLRERLTSVGLDADVNFGLLFNRTGQIGVVASERKLQISRAYFEAYRVPLPDSHRKLWYMDDNRDIWENETIPAKLSDFRSGSDTLLAQLARLRSIPVEEVSWELESDTGVSYKHTVLGLGSSGLDKKPIRSVRSASITISRANETTYDILAYPLSGQDTAGGSLGLGREAWWSNGTATVTTGVVRVFDSGGLGTTSSLQWEAIRIDASRSAIQDHTGDIVTIQSKAAGTKLSVRDVLVRASSCPPDMVGQAGVCVPAIVDATLHVGVLYSGGEVLTPYFGVNNEYLDRMAKPYSGEFEITGRVKATEDVDPRIDSPTVMQVFDMKKAGGASPSEEIRAQSNEVRNVLQEQLESNKSEWSSIEKQMTPESAGSQNSTTTQQPSNTDSRTQTRSDEKTERNESVTPGQTGPGFTVQVAFSALVMGILWIRLKDAT